MGTPFDFFSPRSAPRTRVSSAEAQANRRLLADAMRSRGFVPYSKEWWHFTLRNEPFPRHVLSIFRCGKRRQTETPAARPGFSGRSVDRLQTHELIASRRINAHHGGVVPRQSKKWGAGQAPRSSGDENASFRDAVGEPRSCRRVVRSSVVISFLPLALFALTARTGFTALKSLSFLDSSMIGIQMNAEAGDRLERDGSDDCGRGDGDNHFPHRAPPWRFDLPTLRDWSGRLDVADGGRAT